MKCACEPCILGVSSEANFAVVSLIVLAPGVSSLYLPLAALVGTALVTLLILSETASTSPVYFVSTLSNSIVTSAKALY